MSQTTKLDNSRPVRNFLRGISSDQTRRTYSLALTKFAEFHKVTDFDDLAKSSTEQIDNMLEDYLDHMDSNGAKTATKRTSLAGIERFFTMNKCLWHRDIIRKGIAKDTTGKGGKEAIKTEDIAKMLTYTSSLRAKALVHFFASTGARVGAITDPVLRIKHMEKMPDGKCYAVHIYSDSEDDKYWAFLTPEATAAMDAYLESRKLDKTVERIIDGKHEKVTVKGEVLTGESPIFVNKHDLEYGHMSSDSARIIVTNLMKHAGIKREKKGVRHTSAAMHQFRKRFDTICKISPANDNIVEKLMGHKRGLDGVYLQPTREECYAEFVKAVEALTIDQTARKDAQLEDQAKKLAEQGNLKVETKNLNDRLSTMEHNYKMDMDSMKRQIYNMETAQRAYEDGLFQMYQDAEARGDTKTMEIIRGMPLNFLSKRD